MIEMNETTIEVESATTIAVEKTAASNDSKITNVDLPAIQNDNVDMDKSQSSNEDTNPGLSAGNFFWNLRKIWEKI